MWYKCRAATDPGPFKDVESAVVQGAKRFAILKWHDCDAWQVCARCRPALDFLHRLLNWTATPNAVNAHVFCQSATRRERYSQ